MTEDEEFLRDLMETFRQDAEEHIRALSTALVELEAAGEGYAAQAPLETLFREAHSLKGAAAAVEYALMVSICQNVESVFSALKHGELQVTSPVVDALSECVDCLQGCLVAGEAPMEGRVTAALERLSAVSEPAAAGPEAQQTPPVAAPEAPRNGWQAAEPHADEPMLPIEPQRAQPESQPAPAATPPAQGAPAEPRAAPTAPVAAATDTVRVATNKLESLMLQAEEFISVKLSSGQQATALRDLSARLDMWKREWYQARISDDRDKIEEFLGWNSTFMEGVIADIRTLSKSADDERRTIGPMVDDLLEGMKRVLMLPMSSLLSTFPKMIRDLARSKDKQVEFSIVGADVEIDKRVIENLKDPLTHLLRNSVDHGIETPEIRMSRGKSLRGLIRVAVSQLENNKIEICVSDDGGGIDVQRLRDTAVREGYRTQIQVDDTDDSEALRLVFASGLSTTQVVSQVSGRGLGLAIVEEKVENLGGSVAIETELGKGTTFRITIPATLATARGVVAQVSDWPFVMPVVGVDRVVRVHKSNVRLVENRETIQLEGQTLPLVYLHEVLDLPLKPQRGVAEYIQAVVAGSGEERVAFAVDRIIDEQEVLVKTLGPQLARVRNIAGGTIMGSGKVVPIINISDLLQSARGGVSSRGRDGFSSNGGAPRKAVLVVEDSITSRMLLKNVLEAAGFYVRPTVDGVDALSALNEEDFDLVISDIEMPRMDGFELTSKIRGDARLSRLPVMLVTGMESQEHKERGVDVGANAYLTKSSFTQGTLLETARSLL